MSPLLFPATFVLALAIERIAPARPLPPVRGHLLRGLLFFGLAGLINTLLPPLAAHAVADVPGLPLAELPLPVAAVLVFVVADLARYAIHRAMHTHEPLWRHVHRLHHRPQRVDVPGFAVLHPLEHVVAIAATSLCAALLGIAPLAVVVAAYVAFVLGIVQHLNIRTPYWLGYVVQRPEAHSIHHARGVHAYNYGTVVWWDMLFGTYRNPREFAAEAGL